MAIIEQWTAKNPFIPAHFDSQLFQVLDRMGNGVNKNQFLANLVQFTRENDINKPQPEQMLPGAQGQFHPFLLKQWYILFLSF